MSNRTLVELNHDYCPRNDDISLLAWAKAMRLYMGSGEKAHLPHGVTFKHIRHHSEPDPMQGKCDASDKQTASPRLLAALQRAVDLYGKPGGPWNRPRRSRRLACSGPRSGLLKRPKIPQPADRS